MTKLKEVEDKKCDLFYTVKVAVFNNPIFCESQYQTCQFLDRGYCWLFNAFSKDTLNDQRDKEGFMAYTKCTACRNS